jgi:hypothetical protein
MPITPVEKLIQIPGRPTHKYVCCDGMEFEDIDEAVEYDNALHAKNTPPPVYDYVFTIQQAINMAVAESRVVRIIYKGTNQELKKGIENLKGCKLRKPSKESQDVAVIPPCIDPDTWDFNAVNMVAKVKGE